ncbi:MAG TPA: hypothetical protein VFG16_23390 [Streptomyces sp.]|nr:hypothetical protein [Streptomyces sp.]HET6357117.1 hypothetical protein [Streptomyces sp.]
MAASLTPSAAHSVVADEFSQVTLADGIDDLDEPIAMEVLPDRSVLDTARSGELRRTDKDGHTTVIGELSVYTGDEEGLQASLSIPVSLRTSGSTSSTRPPPRQ